MNPGDNFRLSIRNLRQSKLRTFLTCMGVAIGVGAMTCMISLSVGLQNTSRAREAALRTCSCFPGG